MRKERRERKDRKTVAEKKFDVMNTNIRDMELYKDYYEGYQETDTRKIVKNGPYYRDYKEKKLSILEIVFLFHFKNNLCNLAAACSKTKIKRSDLFGMTTKNEYFAECLNFLREEMADLLETGNFVAALAGDAQSRALALRALASKRGYGEKEGNSSSEEIVGFEAVEVDQELEKAKQLEAFKRDQEINRKNSGIMED